MRTERFNLAWIIQPANSPLVRPRNLLRVCSFSLFTHSVVQGNPPGSHTSNYTHGTRWDSLVIRCWRVITCLARGGNQWLQRSVLWGQIIPFFRRRRQTCRVTADCISGNLIPSRAQLEGVHNVQVRHASIGKSHQELLIYFYFHLDFFVGVQSKGRFTKPA